MTEKPELTHDRLAQQFDALMNPHDIQRRLEVLIDEFLAGETLVNKRVLDAGCGTGKGAAVFSQRQAQVVALDIGANLLKYVQERYACTPVQGSVGELPFDDNSFDIVFSTEVIEHTHNPQAAVLEMVRVLRPGGHLVLSTPNKLWQFPVRLASALKLRPYDGIENFLTPNELYSTLARANGTIIEHRGIHLLPFQFTFLHPALRYFDHYGKGLLPLMINQCIHFVKSSA